MCHADIPQSLVPWGYLCAGVIYVSHKHSSVTGALEIHIYVSHKHSLVTGALGASMYHTKHSFVTGALALGASMSPADTPQSLVPWESLSHSVVEGHKVCRKATARFLTVPLTTKQSC
jgi:hypothetical protein